VSSTVAHNSHTGIDTVCQQFVKLFAIQYALTFCLYMRSLYEASLGPDTLLPDKYQAARMGAVNVIYLHWRREGCVLDCRKVIKIKKELLLLINCNKTCVAEKSG